MCCIWCEKGTFLKQNATTMADDDDRMTVADDDGRQTSVVAHRQDDARGRNRITISFHFGQINRQWHKVINF